jgi:hypothetical protein
MLQALQLHHALLRRDVAPDPEIAAERADLIEQRLCAQRQPHRATIVGEALDFEVLERLVALELPAVPVPVGLRQILRRLVPSIRAQVCREVDAALIT